MGSPAMTPDPKSQSAKTHPAEASAGQGDRSLPMTGVVAFRQATGRRFRRDDETDGTPRGEILLFTGVRYERMPEPAMPAPRQRRRS
jgi:aspartate/methionine/tyrosine aminotransferase